MKKMTIYDLDDILQLQNMTEEEAMEIVTNICSRLNNTYAPPYVDLKVEKKIEEYSEEEYEYCKTKTAFDIILSIAKKSVEKKEKEKRLTQKEKDKISKAEKAILDFCESTGGDFWISGKYIWEKALHNNNKKNVRRKCKND